MDGWKEHLIFHLITFFIVTVPVTWLVFALVLEQPYLPMLPYVALGAGIGVLLTGVFKYGLP